MPNSILWIGLVVLWVFVLFPILADRHPRIRRTTDTALATRVLHRGDSKRRTRSGRARKKRTARTHRKRHHGNDAEDRMTIAAEETLTEKGEDLPGDDIDETEFPDDDFEDEGLEESALLDDSDEPDAETAAETQVCTDDSAPARIPPARAPAPRPPVPPYDADEDFAPARRGRGGYDPQADAVASAARYTFRQRVVLALILTTVLCGGLAVAVAPTFWWGCGLAAVTLGAYLAYLRKQVRIEQEIRRRRSARLAGRAQDAEPGYPGDRETAPPRAARPGMDRDTARALRRRSQLLEPDDEDPIFEHLDPYDATVARTIRNRASGGDIRRAAGA